MSQIRDCGYHRGAEQQGPQPELRAKVDFSFIFNIPVPEMRTDLPII